MHADLLARSELCATAEAHRVDRGDVSLSASSALSWLFCLQLCSETSRIPGSLGATGARLRSKLAILLLFSFESISVLYNLSEPTSVGSRAWRAWAVFSGADPYTPLGWHRGPIDGGSLRVRPLVSAPVLPLDGRLVLPPLCWCEPAVICSCHCDAIICMRKAAVRPLRRLQRSVTTRQL